MVNPKRRALNPRRAVALLRVSTEEQHRSGLGLEAQAAAAQAWCDREGVELAAVFRETCSGSAPLEKRTALVDAIDALRAVDAAIFIVAKRDRLARDSFVAMLVERQVERIGARIVAADGTGNGATPGDTLTRRILDATYEHERAMISERTKRALAARKARGMPLGHPPFGYAYQDGALVQVREEQSIIRAILRRHRKGESVRAIAAALNAAGHRTRSGGPWTHTQVHRTIRRASPPDLSDGS